MFKITDHISFDQKGRAQCPSCLLAGKKKPNLSLVPGSDGAFKCFRGCTPQEIREALGDKKDRIIPISSPPAPPPASVVVPPGKIAQAHQRLLNGSIHALQWLEQRGINLEMVQHYRLGIVRSRCGDSTKKSGFAHLPAISIPIPANQEQTAFFQKKRVRPWLSDEDQPDGYRPWSQYGIPATVFFTHQPKHLTQTWLCEGEWDAIALGWAIKSHPLADTTQIACFTCGCGAIPPDEALEKLGHAITIFYDRDQPGATGAERLLNRLRDRGSIGLVPGPDPSSDGWDVSDALNNGFTVDDFAAAAAAARQWEPAKSNNPLRDRLCTNDELLARAPDYTDWLVEDVLTADELFLLAAPPRAGKSIFALTLAKAVATGEKFLGRPTAQGGCLYIQCEDSETKTKERELRQGWDAGLPVFWLNQFKLSEIDNLADLVEELDIRLLVLDTLSRVKDASISESSAEMSQLLEPLQELCKRQKMCGVLVHHTGKINADNAGNIDVFDTIRGSSAIRATCRGSLVLAPDERSYRLYVENGWGKLDLAIALDLNTLSWKLIGNWIAPTVDVPQKDRVLDYLLKVRSATIDDIFEATNIPKRSLYEVLKRLQSDELIEKRGHRQSSRYVKKSIQQIQQLNPLLNGQEVERERVSSPIQQDSPCGGEAEKVILQDESDQHVDHFPEREIPPTNINLLNKTSEPSQAEDCSYSTAIQHNSTAEKSDPNTADRYVEIRTGRFEGTKAQIINDYGDGYEVQAESWLVTRVYSKSQVKVLSS